MDAELLGICKIVIENAEPLIQKAKEVGFFLYDFCFYDNFMIFLIKGFHSML